MVWAMKASRRRTPVAVLDVGGSSMRQAQVSIDKHGTPRIEGLRSLPVPGSADAAVAQVLQMAQDVGSEAAALGVVVPGIVDEDAGVGVWSENIGWRDIPFADLLAQRLPCPVAFGHDVRAWGLAEATLGAARGKDNVAVVPVGTGIAAALIVDGKALRARGVAGEIGHLRVGGEQPCRCGGTGCLEAVASATAIVRTYNAEANATVEGAVEVVQALLAGDPVAARVWWRAVDYLADGLAAVAAVLAPETFIIGGGLAGAGEDLLFQPLRDRLVERVTYGMVPELVPATFVGTGGLIGAALLAQDRLAARQRSMT